MKTWLYTALSVILVILAICLRLYQIDRRSPFDWDQNRDILAIGDIAKGKPVLIGPVAKGEGGFLLGPLYYYVVTPGFLVARGDPIALPITSALLDVLAIVVILVLLPAYFGRARTLLLAFMWAISWFAIESSRISWNVALLHVWLVSFIFFLLARLTPIKAAIFGFILGLTWHIHPSIIPLSLIITFFCIKSMGFTLKNILLITLGYVLALSPLIAFDIRHSGLEHRLILEFFSAKSGITYPLQDVIVSVFSRFGKNTIAILTGSSALLPWYGVGFALLSFVALVSKSRLVRISGLIVLVNLALTIYLGEPGFPEYYLASSYLPVLVVLIYFAFSLPKIFKVIPLGSLILFIYYNAVSYTITPTSFSLYQKANVAKQIASQSNSADIRYDLPFGRDAGIPYLLKQSGVKLHKDAKSQFVITESTGESIFIDGEIARELGWYGGFRLGSRVVQ